MAELHTMIRKIGDQALEAARQMAELSTDEKNRALNAMADAVAAQEAEIVAANAMDLAEGRSNNLSDAMLDRLTLNPQRIAGIVKSIREVAELPDPVGETIWSRTRPNGLVINKQRVPLGVIAIIYESRPNVTADAAVLCIKTSNSVILRGGKEAFHSNHAIARALQQGGCAAGLPPNALQLIETTDRNAVRELVQMDDRVDVVIPRGGESLIRAVVEHSRVPVLKHYKGVCHIFVDASADAENAVAIVENAKCQRPGVCNAVETLLVHSSIAPTLLPMVAAMAAEQGVELRGCPATCAITPTAVAATEDDWYAEYLNLTLAVRVVHDLNSAIAHINHYGSQHSDAILTGDDKSGERFLNAVDSSSVYLNASTRFTDGGEFGMGAEMGISTDKLHARGPMGLEELTTYKYLIRGKGQIRS